MDTSQSLLVLVTLESDMILVFRSELLHHLIDIFHAASASTHRLGREICVAARAVPVFEELGSERDRHIEIFSDALEKVS